MAIQSCVHSESAVRSTQVASSSSVHLDVALKRYRPPSPSGSPCLLYTSAGPISPSSTSALVVPPDMTSTSTSSAPRAHQRPARDLPVLTPASFNKPRLVTGGHRDAINCLDWSLDGRKLASCAMGGEKGIRIWDSGAGGSTVRSSPCHLLLQSFTPKDGCLCSFG